MTPTGYLGRYRMFTTRKRNKSYIFSIQQNVNCDSFFYNLKEPFLLFFMLNHIAMIFLILPKEQ